MITLVIGICLEDTRGEAHGVPAEMGCLLPCAGAGRWLWWRGGDGTSWGGKDSKSCLVVHVTCHTKPFGR